GAPITQNGTSDGIVPFLKIIDSSILATNQGATRRGNASVNIQIDHGDYYDFLEIREPKGDVNRQCLNLHQCVVVSDKFMRRLEEGDRDARKRWAKLLQKRKSTGEPYIMFKGTVNKANPEAYKKHSLKVYNTNLCCLTGEVEVVTDKGPMEIKDLVGKEVTIFDGKDWVSCSSFEKKGETRDLIEIEFGNRLLHCTTDHRWFAYFSEKDKEKGRLNGVLAHELKPGFILETLDEEPGTIHTVREVRLDEPVAVYCPEVSSTGKFALANGAMTGNSEILLFTDES
ncbi:MAG: hypothetical protein AAGM67_20925, partial [Bacteroidota bacterium]